MNFINAVFIATFSLMIGLMTVIMLKPVIKVKTNKKLPVHICNIICSIGLMIFISFLISLSNGNHLDSVFTYKEYPIEKVTFSRVYFNDNDGYGFNEPCIILEEPKDKYQNIVIAETEDYEVQWLLYKVKISECKYRVYLSNDVYNRLNDGEIVYEYKEPLKLIL